MGTTICETLKSPLKLMASVLRNRKLREKNFFFLGLLKLFLSHSSKSFSVISWKGFIIAIAALFTSPSTVFPSSILNASRVSSQSDKSTETAIMFGHSVFNSSSGPDEREKA